MSLLASPDARTLAYEEHEAAVLGMLAKRFPSFAPDERRDFYHEAWALALEKLEAGEQFDSIRNYLLVSAAGRALDRIKSLKRTQPADPFSRVLDADPGTENPSEEAVLLRDQARIAREIIDSLDERKRALFKLRWDIQMDPHEVRRVLSLTVKQYEHLAADGAAVIARKVMELQDGTWSKRQRSLLAACVAGIATGEQRALAQRRLEEDPHVRALFAEVDRVVGKAAALMPVPAVIGDRSGALARAGDVLATAKTQLSDALTAGKQHAATLATRADPTPLTAGRPGAATAVVASCLAAAGGGGYCATHGLPDAVQRPLGIARSQPPKPQKVPPTPAPDTSTPVPQTATPPELQPATPSRAPSTSQPPEPEPEPEPTTPPPDPTERNFGIEQTAPTAKSAQTQSRPVAPSSSGGGGGGLGFER